MGISMHGGFQRRVVVSGLGVISPSGLNLRDFWDSVRGGRCPFRKVTRFKAGDLPARIAAEIQGFNPGSYIEHKKIKRFGLAIQYAIAAAKEAVLDAGIQLSQVDADRLGVVEATSLGGIDNTLKGHLEFLDGGYRAINPYVFINAYCGGGSGELAHELGAKGFALTYCSGSASGNDAIGHAFKLLQGDEADLILVGGSEAPLIEPLWHGLCLTKVMTRHSGDPREAMKPYDRLRDGFVLGEGAAYLVLEELTHALARGARIYAEIRGHGRSCEAYDSVTPHPEGAGLYRAMAKALGQARLAAPEIDYINTHGTATKLNDIAETVAIKKAFANHLRQLAVSSTKPVTGHLLGAAGAIETVICALAIHHQTIPPTINLSDPDEGFDLDYVPGQSRPYPIRLAMNLNVGFGGKNSCLILGRYDPPPPP